VVGDKFAPFVRLGTASVSVMAMSRQLPSATFLDHCLCHCTFRFRYLK
jgi:hypothetical protein